MARVKEGLGWTPVHSEKLDPYRKTRKPGNQKTRKPDGPSGFCYSSPGTLHMARSIGPLCPACPRSLPDRALSRLPSFSLRLAFLPGHSPLLRYPCVRSRSESPRTKFAFMGTCRSSTHASFDPAPRDRIASIGSGHTEILHMDCIGAGNAT